MSLTIPRWTPEEDEIAIAFVAAGFSTSEGDGKIPGRTGKALRTRVNYLKMSSEKRARMNQRRRNHAAEQFSAVAPKARRQMQQIPIEPPPEVIWEAIQRAMAPRSITAIICGDPPLIASALGKRMAGVSA